MRIDPWHLMDRAFQKGWNRYINGIQKENEKSNERLCRVLLEFKSTEFINDLRNMHNAINPFCKMRIARKPSGFFIKADKKYPTIPGLWIDQRSNEGGMSGTVYVQVKANRWIKITY